MENKEPVEMNEEELAAVTGGTNGAAPQGSPEVMFYLSASSDIQTVLQMVQADRLKVLEAQMIGQMQQVQQHNETFRQMNNTLASLNAEARDGGHGLSLADSVDPGNPDAATWGETLDGFGVTGMDADGNGTLDKAEIDTTITAMKGAIDAAHQNQQMDMLRLQSLYNKRNETFELLNAMQRTGSDPVSGIIRNI